MGKMRDEVSRLNMGLEDRWENAVGSSFWVEREAFTLLMATWLRRPELLLLDEAHCQHLIPKAPGLGHWADGPEFFVPPGTS